MRHPSVFELARFIEGDAESSGFEAHVSECDACAGRLSSLAHRAMRARGLAAELDVSPARGAPPALVALVALTACLAVFVSLPARADLGAGYSVVSEAPAYAPEGVHGVAAPPRIFPRPSDATFADAGPSRED
jgi:hypothetical protein